MNPAIHAAIAAAAEEKRKRDEEEERMTRYTPDELEQDWEFKIVRSSTNAFRKTQVFEQVVQEESLAGWQLLEKLDDGRLRFKRPVSVRRRDTMLPPGIDPYRTTVGSNATPVILALTVTILLIGVLVAVFTTQELSAGPIPVLIPMLVIGLVVFALVVVLAVRSRSK
jgi:hypothetical protein